MEVAREPARDCLPMGLREDCFPHTCNPLGSQAHADSLIMSQLVFCVSLTDSEEQKRLLAVYGMMFYVRMMNSIRNKYIIQLYMYGT